MANIKTFQVNDGGEARVGIDREYNEVCVSLALNLFENDEQWGAQPLTRKEAM